MKNNNKQSKRVKYCTFHNLYIITVYNQDGKPFIKFGFSDEINKRVATYTNKNPFAKVSTFYRSDAKEFELWYHSAFKSVVMDEWYDASNMETLITLINNTPANAFGTKIEANSIPTTINVSNGAFTNTGSIGTMVVNQYIYPTGVEMPALPNKNR